MRKSPADRLLREGENSAFVRACNALTSAPKVAAVPSQRRLNRISRLTRWRVLHRASSYSCSSPAVAGIWGHAYEVSKGSPFLLPDFGRGSLSGARTRRSLRKCAVRRFGDDHGDPVGASDDESTRGGRSLEDRGEIVKTRLAREGPRLAISVDRPFVPRREVGAT